MGEFGAAARMAAVRATAVALVTLLAAPAAAGPVRATRIAAPPVIDGRIDDVVWTGVPVISEFVQDEPREGEAPTERTEVMLAFDDAALYVAARLHDTQPDGVLARPARRDRGSSSDRFMVYLDPRRDLLTGVYFGINAAGTQYDGTLSNDESRNDTWDGVWEAEVGRNGQGWTVEMRIPLSQLRFEGGGQRPWGINVERVIERKKEADLLVFTPRTSSGFVSRFAALEGLESVRPPRRLEVAPYFSLRSQYEQRDDADPFESGRLFPGRAGVDVKVGLGGGLTLDATVFPDFGQVEVDPAVINLSDVETFYPEKRLFFIEGASIIDEFGRGGSRGNWNFDVEMPRLFYSRRIGRSPAGEIPDEADYQDVPDAAEILGAVKLTGKQGSFSVATVHALTAREVAAISREGAISHLAVEPLTYHGMARLQRSMSDGRYGVGLLATTVARNLDAPELRDQFNSTGLNLGLDAWSLLGAEKTWALNGWTAMSRVGGNTARITELQQSRVRYLQRPDASHLGVDPTRTSLTGQAGRVAINKQRGQVICNAAAAFITPGFEANDLGFQSISDVVTGHVGAGYSWPDPGRVYRNLALIAAVWSTWDFGGTNSSRGLFAVAEQQFVNYWQLNVSGGVSPQTMSTRRTRGGPLMVNPRGWSANADLNTDSRKALSGGFGGAVSQSARQAEDNWRLSAWLNLRLMDRLNLGFEPAYSRTRTIAQYLDTEEDPLATATFGQRYLFGDLDQRTVSASLRGSVIITPRLSFELYVQPLLSSIHYDSVRQLLAPGTFELGPTAADPATYSEGVASLRGSAVLRWEYMRGSTFYVVWNGNQGRDDLGSRFPLGRGARTISRLDPSHVFMVKATYWWGG